MHERPKGLVITLTVNWLIKPFTMAALGGCCSSNSFFAPFIEPGTAGQYIAGMILLGAAPCTAMVFVWSTLTKGDPNYTLAQVSLNDAIIDLRLCADRGAAARRHRYQRAVGHADPLGRALYRGAAHRRGC